MANSLNQMKPVFSVSDFLAVVNQTLEYAYPSVEVEGEVSGFKVSQNKWVFFDLKDTSGSVGCFMSVYQLRTPIEDGMKIVVRATAKLTTWGKFSLTVQALRPSGEGALKKSFEILKARLDAEGLFAIERKRPLPEIPQRIAVVTSAQAAGYADFVKILNERWGGLDVEVASVQVQGEAAPDQMIRAIRYFNEKAESPDVIVIIRGGGSADDLSAFNDEKLVREIAASRIPTLVGVGHEVDTSLADMAADVRAATPSNAAQIVVPDRRAVIDNMRDRQLQIASTVERLIDDASANIRADLGFSLTAILGRIDELQIDIVRSRATLSAYDPKDVLRRGYALVRGDVVKGKLIEIETMKKLIKAEVTDVKSK